MDERTQRLIEGYLPHPRDPELGEDEYYYMQAAGMQERVIRVVVRDIFLREDSTEYGIYQQRGHNLVRIDTGWGSPFRGVNMGNLYDNKEDCRDRTHPWYDSWEDLRKLQQEQEVQDG